jgi:hypothetical protein
MPALSTYASWIAPYITQSVSIETPCRSGAVNREDTVVCPQLLWSRRVASVAAYATMSAPKKYGPSDEVVGGAIVGSLVGTTIILLCIIWLRYRRNQTR